MTPQPEDPVLFPGQLLDNGRYNLLWMLGKGGSCMVWLAQDERLNTVVALKFILPEMSADPQMLKELRFEATRIRPLAHPNIVQLYDLYEAPDERPFLIMEHVDGSSLHTLRLQQPNQVLTWEFLKPVALQICQALDYAHSEGLVHRDLKPANLMIDRRGRLKLADFGISSAINDGRARLFGIRDVRGTATFMSPQQMLGEPPQVTDDIYAFGATIYELLASRPPFFAGNIEEQVRNLTPQPIHAALQELGIRNHIPPYVASLLQACLRKDPSERPQSTQELMANIGGLPAAPGQIAGAAPPIATGRSTAANRFSREFHIVMWFLFILLVLALSTMYLLIRYK